MALNDHTIEDKTNDPNVSGEISIGDVLCEMYSMFTEPDDEE